MGKLEGFVEIHKIYDFCQQVGFLPAQINFSLDRALKKKLLEPSPIGSDQLSEQAFRISTVGAYTARRLCRYFTYIDAIIVDTPIVDEAVRHSIGPADDLHERLTRAANFVNYLNAQWQRLPADRVAWDWPTISQALQKEIAAIAALPTRRKGITRGRAPLQDDRAPRRG